MPKGNKKQNSTKNIEDYIFNFLLFVINLFIEVGEATKLILLLPFKILLNIYKVVTKSLNKIFQNVSKFISLKKKSLSKLIVSLKSNFKITKPKFKIKLKYKFKIPSLKITLTKKLPFKVLKHLVQSLTLIVVPLTVIFAP